MDLAICTHRSPWPKSELWFCLLSRRALFPTDSGVLWVRRIDHLSDPSQSLRLQDSYRQKSPQGQCKSIRAFFILRKIARRFPSAFHFNSLRIIRDKSNIHTRHAYQGARAERVIAWEARKKSCLLGAGGTGNVQEKTFLINCHGIAGQDWYGSGISPEPRKKSQPHCRNSFFPAAYHSAVLRVWSCDSSVARYSRSEARSA